MNDARRLFWVEFMPHRPDFFRSMQPEEAVEMSGHLKLLEALQEGGRLEFAGRASDASHGVAIIAAESEDALKDELAGKNPAVKAGLLVPRIRPYRTPSKYPGAG